MSAKRNWRTIKIGEDAYQLVKKEKEALESKGGVKVQFRAMLDMLVKKGIGK